MNSIATAFYLIGHSGFIKESNPHSLPFLSSPIWIHQVCIEDVEEYPRDAKSIELRISRFGQEQNLFITLPADVPANVQIAGLSVLRAGEDVSVVLQASNGKQYIYSIQKPGKVDQHKVAELRSTEPIARKIGFMASVKPLASREVVSAPVRGMEVEAAATVNATR